MLNILQENAAFLVVNKPPGLAAQPDKTGDDSLLTLAEQYCGHALHLVHRIDRPVSGLMLLAKTTEAMAMFSAQFQARRVQKDYLAVVQNLPPEPEGILVHFLKKNQVKNTSTVFDEEQPGTERAELRYRLLQSTQRYHFLHIQLITGRHHQIRAQLAAIGCPIKGDVKYGARRSNPDRSIHLHAWRFAFDNPATGERISLEAAPPEEVLWQAFVPAEEGWKLAKKGGGDAQG
ncbi:MAG: RluA family pseudouridine synthase [Saprospiraceae bacterium]